MDKGVIPEDLAVRLSKAVGFCNIAVHAYHEIDWGIVFSIITQRLEDFPRFTRCIIDYSRGHDTDQDAHHI